MPNLPLQGVINFFGQTITVFDVVAARCSLSLPPMSSQQKQRTRRQRFGRPPAPPDARRSERVVTFVTPDEMAKLRALADREGQSLSFVTNRLLTGALTSSPRSDE